MDFVLLTTAVELAGRWRGLAERLAKVSRLQMDAYEAPHRDRNGVVDVEVRRGEGNWREMDERAIGQVAAIVPF